MKNRGLNLPLLLLLSVLPLDLVSAQKIPTPIATEFTIEINDSERLAVGWDLPLAGIEQTRVGLVATCDHRTGVVEVIVYFGFFPAEKAVQLAVRRADGTGWRHAQPIVGSTRSGLHVPILSDSEEVTVFLHHALARGSLISNGHNSFWNRLPEEENNRALALLAKCGDA